MKIQLPKNNMQDSIVKKKREDTMMWHEREIEKEKNE